MNKGHVIKVDKKIFKFLVSGATAAGAEYAVFLGMLLANINIATANIASFVCGLLVSFFLNKLWVFENKVKSTRQFVLYCFLAVLNLSISTIFIWYVIHETTFSPALAKLLSMGIIAIWNYVIFSKFVFRKN